MKDRAQTSLPFLDEQALLGALWPELDRFVNAVPPEQAVSPDDANADPNIGRLATDAELIGPGEWLGLRLLLAKVLRGAPVLIAPRVPLRLGRRGWILESAESLTPQARLDRYHFTIALLRLPALHPLLRQCDRDGCRRFFVRRRAHRRPHSFCTPECRFAFHRSQRERKEHADYMRTYRRNKARQRELRRKLGRKETK